MERKLRFALGGSNRGKVKNLTVSWQWLHNKFSQPAVTSEPFADYLSGSDDYRNELKNVDGYWIGAHCRNGIRSQNTIEERWAITFDVDTATVEMFEAVKTGMNALGRLAYLVHTSRKHTPEKPRFRIVFPVKAPIPIHKYAAVVRILASKLDPTMNTVDHASFRPAQMMYFPSVSKDMRDVYEFIVNEGNPLDWQGMLVKFDREVGDHENFDILPRGTNEKNARATTAKAQDPREKNGLIGAFCRMFSVHNVIERWLSDVYVESDDFSNKPRYTYVGGSGANGVVVEDDGLFIYSHHGTDPCGERLCNAWDMLSLHLYGYLDSGFDPEGDPRALPSYKAMMKHVGAMPEVVREAASARHDDILQEFADLGPEAPVANGKGASEDLSFELASLWTGEAPKREWLFANLVPHRTVTMLGGDGGTGKSLLALQAAVATATADRWIGRQVLKPGPVLFLSAEDDRDELHRRLLDICASTGTDIRDLCRLHIRSLAGEDALLATLDRKANVLRPTSRYAALASIVAEVRPALIVLDTLADLHAGEENNRAHARQFVGLLQRLAIRHDTAVVVLAHPSLTGMSSGSGLSGSTAWSNSVRSRLYLDRVKDGSEEPDTNARILRTKKANYGPTGDEIPLRWDDGVFTSLSPEFPDLDAGEKACRVFLKLLDLHADRMQYVSPNRSSTYKPAKFAKDKAREGCTKSMFETAMSTLLDDGTIEVGTHGKTNRPSMHLERAR
jgi:hypothetical protein